MTKFTVWQPQNIRINCKNNKRLVRISMLTLPHYQFWVWSMFTWIFKVLTEVFSFAGANFSHTIILFQLLRYAVYFFVKFFIIYYKISEIMLIDYLFSLQEQPYSFWRHSKSNFNEDLKYERGWRFMHYICHMCFDFICTFVHLERIICYLLKLFLSCEKEV